MGERIRQIGDAVVEYIPDRSHRHEGAHKITVAEKTILIRPDGRTTARRRLDAARRALTAAADVNTFAQVRVETVIGAVVLAGASNIEVDGMPLFDGTTAPVAVLRLEVSGDGTINVSSIGGKD